VNKSNLKNILMILQSDYPPDIRLTKEIKALTNAGYIVHLLCNNSKNFAIDEEVDGAHVHRLSRFSKLPFRLAKLLRLPLFFSPLWRIKAASLIKKLNIDSLHIHDLPLAPMATSLGKRFHLPVVYDMHENYPATMREWKKGNSFFQGFIKNPKVAELLNNHVLKHANKVIVVVEEQRDNLIQHGVDMSKIHVVGNTVDVEAFEQMPIDSNLVQQYKKNFLIMYIGSFSTERGLETAIEAIKHVKKDIPHAKLLLVGDGKNTQDLKEFAISMQIEESVEFVGWVDFSKVPSYMEASDLNIIPQPSNPANDTTLPHKLFQYMLIGKPVLTSDAKPLKRIVEETKSGLSFSSQDPRDFARAVLELYKSDTNFAENGRKAVENKYNWENTSKELVKLYSTLK
jgi:glycosyltransferase involved in cell wall biosynthesis